LPYRGAVMHLPVVAVSRCTLCVSSAASSVADSLSWSIRCERTIAL
jgi:hypothetical protein